MTAKEFKVGQVINYKEKIVGSKSLLNGNHKITYFETNDSYITCILLDSDYKEIPDRTIKFGAVSKFGRDCTLVADNIEDFRKGVTKSNKRRDFVDFCVNELVWIHSMADDEGFKLNGKINTAVTVKSTTTAFELTINWFPTIKENREYALRVFKEFLETKVIPTVNY